MAASNIEYSSVECLCHNTDLKQIYLYRDDDDSVIGFRCKLCDKEYISRAKVNLSLLGENFILQKTVRPSRYGHTPFPDITSALFYLKRGDHVSWRRWLGYWHHGIVESIEDVGIRVIEYTNDGCTAIVKRTYMNKCEGGMIYRVDYHEDSTDPSWLVIARARSAIGEKKYSLATNNCEHFVTSCKNRSHESLQLYVMGRKIYLYAAFLIARAVLLLFILLHHHEYSWHHISPITQFHVTFLFHTIDLCLFVVFICLESFTIVYSVVVRIKQKQCGERTRRDMWISVNEKVWESLIVMFFITAYAVSRTTVVSSIKYKEWLDIVVPNVIIIVFLWVGLQVGRIIGICVAKNIINDERNINHIADIKLGNHIVLPSYMFFSRRHAVVVDINRVRNRIRIVRKLSERRTWIDFPGRVYQVMHNARELEDQDNVLLNIQRVLSNPDEYSYLDRHRLNRSHSLAESVVNSDNESSNDRHRRKFKTKLQTIPSVGVNDERSHLIDGLKQYGSV